MVVWLGHFQPRAVEQSAVAHFERLEGRFRSTDREPDWLDQLLKQEPPPTASELWLTDLDLEEDDLAPLRDLRYLRVLAFERSRFAPRELRHISRLHELEYLYLGDTPVDAETLREIVPPPSLSYLSCRRGSIGDAELTVLSTWKMLRHLGLDGTSVTDAGLIQLADLTRVETLWLDGTEITDEGLPLLAELPRLRTLFLCSTGITDAGMPALAKLPRLEQLDLYDTRVSDQGLRELIRSKSLNEICVGRTHISDRAIQQSKIDRPDWRFSLNPLNGPDRPRPPPASTPNPHAEQKTETFFR